MLLAKTIPSLAAGCTVVLKPLEYAPLTAQVWAEILKAEKVRMPPIIAPIASTAKHFSRPPLANTSITKSIDHTAYRPHEQHTPPFAWDLQAMIRGEDSAVAALSQLQLRCQSAAAIQIASSNTPIALQARGSIDN